MTAKFSASADGTKVNIGTAAEDALQIDSTAKTIKPVSPYKFSGEKAYAAGEVIQQRAFTDNGGAASGTGFTNVTTSLKTFTPKSANSTLVIDVTAQINIGAVSGANARILAQIFENTVSTRLGSSVATGGTTSAGGVGAIIAGAVRAIVQNTALTARSFGMTGWTDNASGAGSIQWQSWVITEIQN